MGVCSESVLFVVHHKRHVMAAHGVFCNDPVGNVHRKLSLLASSEKELFIMGGCHSFCAIAGAVVRRIGYVVKHHRVVVVACMARYRSFTKKPLPVPGESGYDYDMM
jgi:hypothetical protein